MDTNLSSTAKSSDFRLTLTNCLFYSLFLGWMAIPLICLRDSSWLQTNWWMPIHLVGSSILLLLWFRSCKPEELHRESWSRPPANFWLSIIAIVVVSLVSFYLPQRKHFWGGYDDFSAYEPTVLHLWGKTFDTQSGRPLLGWSYLFGSAVGGGRIEGFIAFAAFVCVINATLLCVYLRSVLTNAEGIALGAALLLIVNRSDPLKFYPLWAASPYGLAVGFLLLAMFLFHASWRLQNRGLLLLACASLGTTLLMYEVGYLLALIPLVGLWFHRKQNRYFFLWAYCWIATLGLFASRVVIFQLTNKDSYQLKQAAESKLTLGVISRNALTHLKPIGSYFKLSESLWLYGAVGAFVFIVVASAVWWVAKGTKRPAIMASILAMLFASFGILCAIAPYSHIPGVERTQFFASPSQAVLVAFAIGIMGCALPRVVSSLCLGVVFGALAANATVESYRLQDRKFHVTYDKTVHVCQQILALSSQLSDDELIVLLHKDPSPLGVSYGIFSGSPFWVGAHIVAIGEAPNSPVRIDFQDESATVVFFDKAYQKYTYDHLIVFRLDQDGSLYLSSKWPVDARIPAVANGYAPLKLLASNKIVLPKDFDYPAWSAPPIDIVNQRDGIILGGGWSSLQFETGWLYRNMKQDAELIVNSQGQSQVALDLDLGPCNNDTGVTRFEVVNSDEAVVAKGEFAKRGVVHLNLPCSPKQLEVFRIRSASDPRPISDRRDVLKAYGSRGPIHENPLPPAVVDVGQGGLELGAGWYPREQMNGQAFRWLERDGKILTGDCAPGESPGILFEIAPGPGMDGGPCQVELWDAQTMLASRSISSKEEWAVKLPEDYPQQAELSLRVVGGGKKIPSDPRILNLMVTKCEWQPKAIEPPDIVKGRIALGTGWYPYESFGGEQFRWLNTQAQVIYRANETIPRSSLILDISPGPGLNGMPGNLEVVDSAGSVLASGQFDRRMQLTLTLNDLPAGRNTLELHVRGGGHSIPTDPRILNAQIYQCEWRGDAKKE